MPWPPPPGAPWPHPPPGHPGPHGYWPPPPGAPWHHPPPFVPPEGHGHYPPPPWMHPAAPPPGEWSAPPQGFHAPGGSQTQPAALEGPSREADKTILAIAD